MFDKLDSNILQKTGRTNIFLRDVFFSKDFLSFSLEKYFLEGFFC